MNCALLLLGLVPLLFFIPCAPSKALAEASFGAVDLKNSTNWFFWFPSGLTIHSPTVLNQVLCVNLTSSTIHQIARHSKSHPSTCSSPLRFTFPICFLTSYLHSLDYGDLFCRKSSTVVLNQQTLFLPCPFGSNISPARS